MDGEFIHAITKAALSGEVCHRCGHAWHSDSCVNVAPAVEPAQSAAEPYVWASDKILSLVEHKDNHPFVLTKTKCAANTVPLYLQAPSVPPAIVEPAQAVPVAHMRVMVGCRAPDDCEEYLDVCNPDDVGIDGKAFPVYKVPPAIDDAPRQKAIAHLKSWQINNPVDWVDRRHNSLIHSTLLILEAGNVDQN